MVIRVLEKKLSMFFVLSSKNKMYLYWRQLEQLGQLEWLTNKNLWIIRGHSCSWKKKLSMFFVLSSKKQFCVSIKHLEHFVSTSHSFWNKVFHSVCWFETLCFKARNTLFLPLKHFVSLVETKPTITFFIGAETRLILSKSLRSVSLLYLIVK